MATSAAHSGTLLAAGMAAGASFETSRHVACATGWATAATGSLANVVGNSLVLGAVAGVAVGSLAGVAGRPVGRAVYRAVTRACGPVSLAAPNPWIVPAATAAGTAAGILTCWWPKRD